MGQQHGVIANSQGASDWDNRSTFSNSSKRFRRKLRNSFRSTKNRSCRDLSATYQYSSAEPGNYDQLNLNTANEDELMTLTGITRPVAQNIIEHRGAIGGFRKIEDLALVSGVGAARLELLRHDVCVRNNLTLHISQSLDSLSSSNQRCSSKVNINSATMFDLMAIPGVTQHLAANICHQRDKKQRFKNMEALLKVKGMTPNKFALMRPYISLGESTEGKFVTDGIHQESNERVHTPTSPSISLKSRKSRKYELIDSLDHDIYRLVSHLSVRPVASRTEPASISQSRLRIALWRLDDMGMEKVSNLGVQEVICRTLLENEISIMVCQDIQSLSVGDILVTELNQPVLSRIASWEAQERRWHAIFPRRGDQQHNSDIFRERSANLVENNSGFIYSASNGLRHLEVKLVSLRENLAPALVTHFEILDTINVSVVSVDLRGLNSDELPVTLADSVRKLTVALGTAENIIVCGNFLTSPTDQAFDEMIRLGFHLLHPISSREDDHLHIWCSSGAGALCSAKEAIQIRQGLNHPMIPKGHWHFGGAVSSHRPVVIEMGLPKANGIILNHGHVLNNGMVSAN